MTAVRTPMMGAESSSSVTVPKSAGAISAPKNSAEVFLHGWRANRCDRAGAGRNDKAYTTTCSS